MTEGQPPPSVLKSAATSVVQGFKRVGHAVDAGASTVMKDLGGNVRAICPHCDNLVLAPPNENVNCPKCTNEFHSPTVTQRTVDIGQQLTKSAKESLGGHKEPQPVGKAPLAEGEHAPPQGGPTRTEDCILSMAGRLPQMPTIPISSSTGGEDEEIRTLTEQLQHELGSLAATHSVLESDMQRLASMLAPFMTPAGRLNLPEKMDPKVLLFKQGLDYRIAEYNEDCRRLESVQERLQRKLEEAAGAYERTFMGASGLADARIIRRLEELQRIIQIQQRELDQARFERDIVSDEAKRLRQLFIRVGSEGMPKPQVVSQEALQAPYSLHSMTAAKFVPMAGPSGGIHSAVNPVQGGASKLPLPTQQTTASRSNAVTVPSQKEQTENSAVEDQSSWGGWWNSNGKPAVASSDRPAAAADFL